MIDPASDLDAVSDLLVEDGRISKIGQNLEVSADREIDATGFIVSPGFIDIHVHLREPGREDEETIESGSKGAAAGGVTSIVCMPHTEPPGDNRSWVQFLVGR